jgi:Ser/Thr protein kinase RdoA (MazF antagonist)
MGPDAMKSFQDLTHKGQVARLKRLAERALRDYGIIDGRLTPLTHMENTTFRVDATDGLSYVIRIHRSSSGTGHPRRNEAQVRSEMEWLAALGRDTDLAVPEPVRTRDGQLLTIAEIEGVPDPRICVLFRWVEGRFISRGLTPKHLERVGVFIARLHDHVTTQFTLPEGFTRPTVGDLSDKNVRGYLDSLAEVRPPSDVEMVRAVALEVQRTLNALDTGRDMMHGLIHADLHQDNYLFHRGEVRAIDFDDCGFGHFLYDLTVTLSELGTGPDYPGLRDALLRGYRSVRPLPVEYEGHLDVLIAFRILQVTMWFVEERHHPAFANWEKHVTRGLARVRAFAAGIDGRSEMK